MRFYIKGYLDFLDYPVGPVAELTDFVEVTVRDTQDGAYIMGIEGVEFFDGNGHPASAVIDFDEVYWRLLSWLKTGKDDDGCVIKISDELRAKVKYL